MQLHDFLGICRFFLSVPFNPVVEKKIGFLALAFHGRGCGERHFRC